MPVCFLIRPAFKRITSEIHTVFLSLSDNQYVARLHPTLTVQHIHLKHKAGAQKLISSVGVHRLRLHSVHSCPKGDKWQVNTPNGLSLYWSAAHFSFHNNNAGGRLLFVGPAGAWMTWGGNRPSNYSFLHLSLLSRPAASLTHWRCRLLNPDEIHNS